MRYHNAQGQGFARQNIYFLVHMHYGRKVVAKRRFPSESLISDPTRRTKTGLILSEPVQHEMIWEIGIPPV